MRNAPQFKNRYFASDNHSGVCPEIIEALLAANVGHSAGYGDDPWTARACDLIREWFETDCSVYFVFNGTAANSIALAAACDAHHAVLCHESAHIQHDECNAPAFFTGGARLLPLPGVHGRLESRSIEDAVRNHFPLHASKPRALSLTQTTECGTVYTPAELTKLCDSAHRLGLRTHLDGARFFNAVASLRTSPKALSWKAGVDILSLGATKNGGLASEAIVVFNRELAEDIEYRIKQSGQLASKMRFAAASWIGLLGSGAWLKHAHHANQMASQLSNAISKLPEASLFHPTQANGVFVRLPLRVIRRLHALGWHFYIFDGKDGCRLMCSWDTTVEDVRDFITDLQRLLPAKAKGHPRRLTRPKSNR